MDAIRLTPRLGDSLGAGLVPVMALTQRADLLFSMKYALHVDIINAAIFRKYLDILCSRKASLAPTSTATRDVRTIVFPRAREKG